MLDRSFYLRDANMVAKDLLGMVLVHQAPQGTIAGMIVETEAYIGPDDAAAHMYQNKRTARTEICFHEGGFAYIYLIYGLYHCFNVVANVAGKPEAVLVRAIEPILGLDIMAENSNRSSGLCNGPGKLCRAMGIHGSHYGTDLCGTELFIAEFKNIDQKNVESTPRINIPYAGAAQHYPWRYLIKGNQHVSRV